MFNILEHLDRLEVVKESATWIQAKCPVCGGTLKIARTEDARGAYTCYTSGCGREIKRILSPWSPFTQSSPFRRASLVTPTIRERIVPVRPYSPVPLSEYLTNTTYTPPIRAGIAWTFQYDDTFRMVRFDTPDGKVCTFQYRDEENTEWRQGLPPYIPIYQQRYIQPSIFVVEGEKCAAYLHEAGYAAISLVAPYRKPGKIVDAISQLVAGNVVRCIYLRDNDHPGLRDARLFRHTAWDAGIDCLVVNPAELVDYGEVQGFDIANIKNTDLPGVLNDAINPHRERSVGL